MAANEFGMGASIRERMAPMERVQAVSLPAVFGWGRCSSLTLAGSTALRTESGRGLDGWIFSRSRQWRSAAFPILAYDCIMRQRKRAEYVCYWIYWRKST